MEFIISKNQEEELNNTLYNFIQVNNGEKPIKAISFKGNVTQEDTMKALSRTMDRVKELESTIEYQDKQLDLMAEAIENKNKAISMLNEVIQNITD